jgi:hypothetical protein
MTENFKIEYKNHLHSFEWNKKDCIIDSNAKN